MDELKKAIEDVLGGIRAKDTFIDADNYVIDVLLVESDAMGRLLAAYKKDERQPLTQPPKPPAILKREQ